MSSANQDEQGAEDSQTRVNNPAILPTEPQCSTSPRRDSGTCLSRLQRCKKALLKFLSFIGPGFIIAVAYSTSCLLHTHLHYMLWLTKVLLVDPGNYSTDIAAGASYRFKLLFIVLLSNLFAIFLQSLAIKLGTVSGLNLAEACRAFLPRWLNIILYIFAEIAIIATDIAEVCRLGDVPLVIFTNIRIPGHRLRNRTEPSLSKSPSCRRVCHLHRRCHGDSTLL